MANHEVASRKFADLAHRVELKAPGVGFEPPWFFVFDRLDSGALFAGESVLSDN
jgi:hypothetical protein